MQGNGSRDFLHEDTATRRESIDTQFSFLGHLIGYQWKNSRFSRSAGDIGSLVSADSPRQVS